ncbi:MAG: acyl-protein synthetase [Myxococcota bacterium]
MSVSPQLQKALHHFIMHAQGDFNTLAVALFNHQFERNRAYQGYCQRLGVNSAEIRHWTEIPTVPTDVFRHVQLFCGEPQQATVVFRTSGTTSGRRGEHYLRTLELYHASARGSIDRFLLPDRLARPALMLAPPPEVLPDSSLSSMLGLIARERAPRSTFAWCDGQLDLEQALEWLKTEEGSEQPVQVLATSFALVELFDRMRALNTTVRLPQGSIVMPTGGTKGRTRAVSPDEVEQWIVELLGVKANHVVSEYGMTELGSQFYDPRLARTLSDDPSPPARCLCGPPWCRVTVHDPHTLDRLPNGEVGLLRFTDLSNMDSVCSVQTSDRGRLLHSDATGDTLVLLGRSPGARPSSSRQGPLSQ